MCMLPLSITPEVTFHLDKYLASHLLQMEPRAQRSKQLGQGLLNKEAGFLIPRLRLLSLAFERRYNSSLRRGMRMLRIASLEDRGTPWKHLGEAACRELSRIL